MFSRIARHKSIYKAALIASLPVHYGISSSSSLMESNDTNVPTASVNSNNSKSDKTVKITVTFNDDESDEEWMAEKQKCSFCQMFLSSPCREPFMYWSKCVDTAKERDVDFISACQDYTSMLMECTTENEEYFASQKAAEEDSGETLAVSADSGTADTQETENSDTQIEEADSETKRN